MKLLHWLALYVIGYLCICFILFIAWWTWLLSSTEHQMKLAFQREPLDPSHVFGWTCFTSDDFTEQWFWPQTDVRLHGLLFRAKRHHHCCGKSRGLVFYTRGCRLNMQKVGSRAKPWLDRGFDVFMFDYRGDGWSTASSTFEENDLFTDAQFVYRTILDRYCKMSSAGNGVVLWGSCLGGALAAYLSTLPTSYTTTIVLENTFSTPTKLTQANWLWNLNLGKSKGKVICFDIEVSLAKSMSRQMWVIHGKKDYMVPYSLANRLCGHSKVPSQLRLVSNGTHGNLHRCQEYLSVIDEIQLFFRNL
jgi:hypothetical protein